jgi:hypothetical protein
LRPELPGGIGVGNLMALTAHLRLEIQRDFPGYTALSAAQGTNSTVVPF